MERAGEAGAKLCQQRDLPRARAERGAGKFGGGLLKVLTAFREKSVVRLCFGLVWVGFFGLLGFFFPNLLGIVEQALMLSMCKAAWVFLELCLL